MATANTALPPLDKISMIGIWVETVLYGVNCIMYALCMFVLLRGGNVPTLRWVLIVMFTIVILLATVHVGASLQQLLDAFVYVPPMYLTTPRHIVQYLRDSGMQYVYASVSQVMLKGTMKVFTQDFVIVANTPLATGYSATAISASPNVGLYDSVVPGLIISAGVLDTTLNVSVTTAIAGRLWWMGRTTAPLTSTRTNRYTLSIYVVIESGAIFAGANIIALALYVSNKNASSAGFTIASQVATLTPLLIIVQVGLTSQHRFSRGNYSGTVPTVRDEMTFRVRTPQGTQQVRSVVLDPRLRSIFVRVTTAQDKSKGAFPEEVQFDAGVAAVGPGYDLCDAWVAGNVTAGAPRGARSTSDWVPIIVKSSVTLGALPEVASGASQSPDSNFCLG
ncbi:hypothetical protein HD554DRAFT_2035247 [Boletus coccyginus]|nr:hypothetical protein HD554DRAFT_2035247 [Boletus coccyginus]